MSRTFVFTLIACAAASDKVIKLGQGIDWPNYAYKNATTNQLMGIAHDIAMGMNTFTESKRCDGIQIQVEAAQWSDCWTENGLGPKLEDGTLDGCMTYTNTKGLREELTEFTGAILGNNKPGGLLTMLDENGNPKVTGMDDLSGKTVVDVEGWAPEPEALKDVENKCTGKKYSQDYKLVVAGNTVNDNSHSAVDNALSMLHEGTADAMFVYADTANSYVTGCSSGAEVLWNCTLWNGFGTKFAYVQTGQYGYVNNGTTLVMAKKKEGGSVASLLNPCLQDFMDSKAYYDICVKYDFVDTCYPNSHFPIPTDITIHAYNKPTNEQTGDCSNGYCPCIQNGEKPMARKRPRQSQISIDNNGEVNIYTRSSMVAK